MTQDYRDHDGDFELITLSVTSWLIPSEKLADDCDGVGNVCLAKCDRKSANAILNTKQLT